MENRQPLWSNDCFPHCSVSCWVVSAVYAQDDQNVEVIAPQACSTPGNLKLWVWDQHWADIIGASVEQWKEDYCPGAQVDVSIHDWEEYWNTLDTNAASGDLPDIFNMSQDRFYFYASKNALLDLQPYFDAASINTSAWASGMVDPYRFGDDFHLYAGPVNWDTVVIFYNKDLLDAAGLAYPTSDWTWDDFAADAQTLTDPQYGSLRRGSLQRLSGGLRQLDRFDGHTAGCRRGAATVYAA